VFLNSTYSSENFIQIVSSLTSHLKFNYLELNLLYIDNNDIPNKLQQSQYICGTVLCTFKTGNKEMLLKLYVTSVVPIFH